MPSTAVFFNDFMKKISSKGSRKLNPLGLMPAALTTNLHKFSLMPLADYPLLTTFLMALVDVTYNACGAREETVCSYAVLLGNLGWVLD